ncbi:hypothetical protein DL766_005612 [Monosporascus sp. MC13-8B]|uniref:NADP-dependent oxidoreductase domain-containing protein n=1 Tax=Monosporascus cannonballus TaxID=155416 RepID=A0ABY0GTQ5_9PEZI|nr:hypothetical protein DL762_009305 [Monosporascus cannonballus]RYO83860.1 hypothetical protein DL763_007673 [Monosporascus cannonballus]RYP28950.1 hypothetical protein DL766_005612 [Monosporascus sp. MC13-8B]
MPVSLTSPTLEGLCEQLISIHEAVNHGNVAFVVAEPLLMSPHTLENGVQAECTQYGIPMLADSPLGGDLLGGRLEPVNQAQKPAARKGCAGTQFVISWLKRCEKRSGMPTTLLICDATTAAVYNENHWTIGLTDAVLE